jgi:hypothetical protein
MWVVHVACMADRGIRTTYWRENLKRKDQLCVCGGGGGVGEGGLKIDQNLILT